MRKYVIAALAAAAAAAASPATTYAAAKPVPCTGMAVTDPAGDQELHVPQVGVPTTAPAAALTDFTGFFIRTDGSTITGAFVISDLTKTVPDNAEAIRWTLYYTVDDKAYWVRAILNSDGTTEFPYGTDDGATLATLGETKGALFEGKDGVISFTIPSAVGGKVGNKLTVANAIAAYQTAAAGLGSSADFMPDDGEFETTITACPGGATAAPPTAGGTTPPPAPPSGGQPPSSGSPTTAPGAPAPKDFRVSVKPTKLRAKKIKPRKPFALTLSASESLTNVTATLMKGRKTAAKGKLAKLSGKGKIKLKASKKLKKGKYVLLITARRSDGSTGTMRVNIMVR